MLQNEICNKYVWHAASAVRNVKHPQPFFIIIIFILNGRLEYVYFTSRAEPQVFQDRMICTNREGCSPSITSRLMLSAESYEKMGEYKVSVMGENGFTE